MKEMFTLQRLQIPSSLHKCLATTNIIESPQSGVQRRTDNVARWRDADMVERWVASAWLLCVPAAAVNARHTMTRAAQQIPPEAFVNPRGPVSIRTARICRRVTGTNCHHAVVTGRTRSWFTFLDVVSSADHVLATRNSPQISVRSSPLSRKSDSAARGEQHRGRFVEVVAPHAPDVGALSLFVRYSQPLGL